MTAARNTIEALANADKLRTSDRAAALSLYAEHEADIASDDADRILWICDQVAPTPPAALAPLLVRVIKDGPDPLRRAARHGQASIAWYSGDARRAETLWAEGLRDAPDVADRTWIRGCLNLAMALFARHVLFEALVLIGTGERAARAAGLPYLTAYARGRRAHILTEMGDVERAAHEVDELAILRKQLTDEGERQVVEYEERSLRAQLCAHHGRAKEALQIRDAQLAALKAQGHVEGPILANVMIEQWCLRFNIDASASSRDAVLDELKTLGSVDLGPSWKEGWEQRFHELRIRHAIDRGDHDDAREVARAHLTVLRRSMHDSETMLRAASLGRHLVETLDAPELGRDAFELASNACLHHVIAAERASREIPELGDATPEDWETLRAYRRRMEDHQREFLDAVAAGIGPGTPVFDHISTNDMLVACAWCCSIRTNEGQWIPIAHYLPLGATPWITHGICEPCSKRVLAGEPVIRREVDSDK